MNKQITKRQHYVQRAYLSEWIDKKNKKGNLFAHRKSDDITFCTGLMGVGQENYFYEMKRLSELELILAVLCAKSSIPALSQNRPYFYLEINQKIWNLQDKLTALKDQEEIDIINKDISNFQKQLGEDIQCAFEGDNITFTRDIIDGDYSFYSDEEKRMEFFFYLAMQYVRTKYIRESLIETYSKPEEFIHIIEKNLPGIVEHARQNNIHIDLQLAVEQLKDTKTNLNIEKTMSYTAISSASEIAYALIIENKMSLTVLHAPDDVKFITGDQPIINLKTHDRDENGNILDIVLYYPLSPKVAILFTRAEEYTVNNLEISSDEVKFYNNFIFQNSYDQVYASSKEEIFSLRGMG